MRAVMLRDIRIVESPDRSRWTRFLLAVAAVSICPSDHHIYRRALFNCTGP